MTVRYDLKKFQPLRLHLLNEGWAEVSADIGTSFEKGHDGECLVLNLLEKQLADKTKGEINWFVDFKAITDIVNRIYPNPSRTHVPLTAAGFHPDQHLRFYSDSGASFSDQDAKILIDQVDSWYEAFRPLEKIKSIAHSPIPDAGGEAQLKHLAALAYLGDFSTLMDYQAVFRRGKRLNFVPMIKPEMIDRAIDIAFERP